MLILVTGSEGLVGAALCARLERSGHEVRRFDVRRHPSETVLDEAAMAASVRGVDGVVHLAAISRVVWGERDPALCEAVNVGALDRLIRLCAARPSPPWIVFASSREVYGERAADDRVRETDALVPMNVYARTKIAGERLIAGAAEAGLVACVCRLSSVYGSPFDHADRVAMAFATAAAHGGAIRIEGSGHAFDFTAVEDVARGLFRIAELSAAGERLPPIHLVTGRSTSLRQLAELAVEQALAPVTLAETAPRRFDVSHFVGDPTRAERLLGWTAGTDVETGFAHLVAAIARTTNPHRWIDTAENVF